MVTPKRLVHWAFDQQYPDFGSPFSEASSSDSTCSTSSLQSINSQLIAHGFARPPGLSLEGLSKDDSDGAVKCILSMLSQRIDDLSRTENLTTKLSTLTYDYERLMSMHRASMERAAVAEKECSLFKSRLAAAVRALQSSENAHKQTTADLQRTRVSLQSVRQTHSAELKRREKESERMVERWSKISEAQVKLGAASASLTFKYTHANAAAVAATSSSDVLGKGKSLLEQALEDAEQARRGLNEENLRLKDIVVCAVNDLSALLHSAKLAVGGSEAERPASYSLTSLFPLAPAGVANDKLTGLLSDIRVTLTNLIITSPSLSAQSTPQEVNASAATAKDISRLQSLVDDLRAELENAKKQAEQQAAQSQALLEKVAFAAQQHELEPRADTENISIELMSAPKRDEELNRLERRARDLEKERAKFTEAAVRFGREKAALEAERLKFLEERRSWQVQMMLDDLPPTPHVPSSSRETVIALPQQSPQRSKPSRSSPSKASRRSPVKQTAATAALGRVFQAAGSAGRSRGRLARRPLSLSPRSPGRMAFTPAYETEVMPPVFAAAAASQPLILPTAFVLPPPSPMASLLPRDDVLGLPRTQSAPNLALLSEVPALPYSQSAPMLATNDSSPDVHSVSDEEASSIVAPPTTFSLAPPAPTAAGIEPRTPPAVRRPFPVAKPFAQHMVHAYSPARPSPLSRILMLADSPASPPGGGMLESVLEDEEEAEALVEAKGKGSVEEMGQQRRERVLAVEAVFEESEREQSGGAQEEESPLREKQGKMLANGNLPPAARLAVRKGRGASGGGDKGKVRAPLAPAPAKVLEKENAYAHGLAKKPKPLTVAAPQPVPTIKGRRPSPPMIGGTINVMAKGPVPAKPGAMRGGPRRVLFGSADAAPVGPSWRG